MKAYIFHINQHTNVKIQATRNQTNITYPIETDLHDHFYQSMKMWKKLSIIDLITELMF